MPSREVHDMDADLMGYSREVNHLIDLPFAWLGRRHRILFHTPEEQATIGLIMDGPNGVVGGLRHGVLDKLCSNNPQLKSQLELMAKLYQPPPKKRGIAIRSGGWDEGIPYRRVEK